MSIVRWRGRTKITHEEFCFSVLQLIFGDIQFLPHQHKVRWQYNEYDTCVDFGDISETNISCMCLCDFEDKIDF